MFQWMLILHFMNCNQVMDCGFILVWWIIFPSNNHRIMIIRHFQCLEYGNELLSHLILQIPHHRHSKGPAIDDSQGNICIIIFICVILSLSCTFVRYNQNSILHSFVVRHVFILKFYQNFMIDLIQLRVNRWWFQTRADDHCEEK